MNAREFFRDPLAIALLALGAINAVVYLVLNSLDGIEYPTIAFYCATPVFSALVLFGISRFYGKGSSEGRVWFFITMGMTLWAVGEIIWVFYDLSDMDPFPSAADAVFIAAYMPIILAFYLKATFTKVEMNAKNNAIIAVLLTAVAIPTFVYVGNPIMTDTDYDLLSKAVSLTYPILDIILLGFALFVAVYWGPTISKGWYIVATAVALMALADTSYAALEWQGVYISHLDLIWVASYIVFALGGLYQKKHHESFM